MRHNVGKEILTKESWPRRDVGVLLASQGCVSLVIYIGETEDNMQERWEKKSFGRNVEWSAYLCSSVCLFLFV